MRGKTSGYAHGTHGAPQTTIEQNEYASKAKENEFVLKQAADNAPLIDEGLLKEIKATGAKINTENTVFTTRDASGQIIWLETGNASAGLKHLKHRGHLKHLANYLGINERDVVKTLRNIIRDGRIISDVVVTRAGRKGYERKYEYKGKRIILAAIGTNGFLVTAYPDD